LKELIAADIDAWKHTEENQEELKQKKEKKVKRSIAIVVAVALIAVLAVSGSAMASRPPSVPPIGASGATVAMEAGYDCVVLDQEEYIDPPGMYVYRANRQFSFEGVRNVSITMAVPGAELPSDGLAVSLWVGFPSGDAKYLHEAFTTEPGDPSYQTFTFQFDTAWFELRCTRPPGNRLDPEDYLKVYINYTFTYPSEIG